MAVTTPDGYTGWNTSTAKKKQPTYDPYVTKDRVPTYSAPVAGYGNTNAGAGTNEYTTTAQRQQQSASVNTPVVNNNNGGGSAPIVSSGNASYADPYASYQNRMIELYQQQLAEEKARQERVRQARINAANTTYNTSMNNLNNAADSSLRQAYIKHMQDQKALPQQMQAFGISGGATETNLANMRNAYGNNRTSILNEKLAQQRMIEQDRANAIASAESDAANYEASAVRDYNNGLLKVYESALSKMPSYSNTGEAKSQITKNPWYDVAVGYLEDGNDVNSVITALKEQGVSEDIIDAILYNWESTI